MAFIDSVGVDSIINTTAKTIDVTSSNPAISGLRKFTEAIADGDLVLVENTPFVTRVQKDADNWMIVASTIAGSASSERVEYTTPALAEKGTISDNDAVAVSIVFSASDAYAILSQGAWLNLTTSSADADITAVAGNQYVVDASGYTANRTLTLPMGAVGDRVSVAITDIANAYSLIITGTGTWGTGEWSRLISQGETVDLLCYSAGSWMISNDGRIPAKCSMARASPQTGILDSTDTQVVGFAAADIAVGVIVDEAAGTITAKRTGTWSAVAKSRLITDALGSIADGSYVSIYVVLGDPAARFDNYESLGGVIQPILITAGSGIITADTAVTMTVYVHQASPTTYAAGSSVWNYPYLSIVETL